MNEILLFIAIGFALVIIGMILIIISVLPSREGVPRSSGIEVGGGVLIGPIPIVFGTTNRMILIASILMLVVLIIAIITLIIPYTMYK